MENTSRKRRRRDTSLSSLTRRPKRDTTPKKRAEAAIPQSTPTPQQSGQVLDMTLNAGKDGLQSIYTIPIGLGPPDSPSRFQVQLDTGSADLWVASASCTTSSCSGVPAANRYSPTETAVQTHVEEPFSVEYVFGSASGPTYWDTMSIGQYAIGNQAFAAANNVESEPLDNGWVGILGMAFSKESVIAGLIQPLNESSGDEPDGATVTNNLWGITPITQAPTHRFFGVLLERPSMPSDTTWIPSQLSIGTHPQILTAASYPLSFTPQPTGYNITALLPQYSIYVSPDLNGDFRFWRATMTSMAMYNPSNTPNPIIVSLPRGRSGLYPSVIFDTGASVIATTSAIANAIYGAIGISPSSDQRFYVPCNTPLNVTITIDTLPPIPIHPLDMSSSSSSSSDCLGTIQPASALDGENAPGDIVLGVPFLRNVYFIGRYDPIPRSDHDIFGSGSAEDLSSDGVPSLTLIPLTNISLALSQFHTLRVLNTPLTTTTPANGTGPGSGSPVKVGSKKVPLAVVIVVALVGLAVVVAALFGGLFFVHRRRMKHGGGGKSRWPARRRPQEKMSPTVVGFRDVVDDDSEGSGKLKAERSYSATSGSVRTFTSKKSGEEFVDSSDFGERGRKLRDGSKSSDRNGSRSISGYFREPEPWEEAETFHPSAAQVRRTSDAEDDDEGERRVSTDLIASPVAMMEDGNEYPFPLHHRTASEIGEIRNATNDNGGGASPLLMLDARRGSLPDTPTPGQEWTGLALGRQDGRYPTTPARNREHTRLGSEGMRRSTVSSAAPPPPLDPFGLEGISTPPKHGRGYSDERYPIIDSFAHRRDRSASSPAKPSPPQPQPSANGSSNPLKALAALIRNPQPHPQMDIPPPLPPIASVPSTPPPPPDSTTGHDIPPPGARTPTHNVMAGVGSGGSSRMMIGLPLDKDLLDFHQSLNKSTSANSPSTPDSRPITYPPFQDSPTQLVESPREADEFGMRPDSETIPRPRSGTTSTRPTVARPRGPRSSLSSGNTATRTSFS